MPTTTDAAEPVLAQGPPMTYTTDPQQGMGTIQPKVLPTETVMGPVTQAGRTLIIMKIARRNFAVHLLQGESAR